MCYVEMRGRELIVHGTPDERMLHFVLYVLPIWGYVVLAAL
jgi:hypothetical protein